MKHVAIFLGCLSLFLSLNKLDAAPSSLMDQNQCDLVGFGAGFIDILIHVEEDFLKGIKGVKGGSDVIYAEELDEIINRTGEKPHIATGGSCANVLKSVASLGMPCRLLSQVGQDALGNHFINYMNQIGVKGIIERSSLPTARVLSLITPDGERTMRISKHSSQDLSNFPLDALYFEGTKLVHLEAYTFRDAYSSKEGKLIKKIIKLAKAAGAKISIDLSSIEIVQSYSKELLAFVRESDLVFGNEIEMQALTGLSNRESCLMLQQICPLVIILKGAEGCIVGFEGQIIESKAFPTKVTDTTGAGDLFTAGFLYSYLKKMPIEKCAENGNRMGSAVVSIEGTELPESEWERLRREIH